MQKQWAHEPGIQWASLYEIQDLGTITATDTFDLDNVDEISKHEGDRIYASNNLGANKHYYNLVTPSQLRTYRYSQGVAKIGDSLLFATPFISTDSVFGYNLYAPVILRPNDITKAGDTIQVDNPMWLVYMMAAELVRNDIVRQNQYGSIVAYAQDLMEKMRQANQGQFEEVITNWRPAGDDYTSGY